MAGISVEHSLGGAGVEVVLVATVLPLCPAGSEETGAAATVEVLQRIFFRTLVIVSSNPLKTVL